MVNIDNVLAIIPARKGSKRLPGKNRMRIVGGLPLWENTAWTAKNAGITNIVISTNDEEIITQRGNTINNFRTVLRPNELCKDETTMEEVITHVLAQVDKIPELSGIDTICLLQPTSPLLTPKTLSAALSRYVRSGMKCLVAVNSQYKPCGAFYIFDRELFMKNQNIWMSGMDVFLVNEKEAIDVDYIYDFRIAEAVMLGNVVTCMNG